MVQHSILAATREISAQRVMPLFLERTPVYRSGPMRLRRPALCSFPPLSAPVHKDLGSAARPNYYTRHGDAAISAGNTVRKPRSRPGRGRVNRRRTVTDHEDQPERPRSPRTACCSKARNNCTKTRRRRQVPYPVEAIARLATPVNHSHHSHNASVKQQNPLTGHRETERFR